MSVSFFILSAENLPHTTMSAWFGGLKKFVTRMASASFYKEVSKV